MTKKHGYVLRKGFEKLKDNLINSIANPILIKDINHTRIMVNDSFCALLNLKTNDILITSDTIVWHNNKALGKPGTEQEAFEMLKSMSNQTHEVITSVCFKTIRSEKTVNNTTKVTFKEFSDEEIWYYVHHFNPMDKAGAYGIQDDFGAVFIKKINGCYYNVVGLPLTKVYQTLMQIIKNVK